MRRRRAIDTEMNYEFWATPGGERLIERIPQRRVGAESDLDGAILFARVAGLAIYDGQRDHGGWRVLVDLSHRPGLVRNCAQAGTHNHRLQLLRKFLSTRHCEERSDEAIQSRA
jgi:hypothetical protein